MDRFKPEPGWLEKTIADAASYIRLREAAPDLYASLDEIVTQWGCPNTPMWHRAMAALKKARGE